MRINASVVKALAPLFIENDDIVGWESREDEFSTIVAQAIENNFSNSALVVKYARKCIDVLPDFVAIPFIGQQQGGYERLPTTSLRWVESRTLPETRNSWQFRKEVLKEYRWCLRVLEKFTLPLANAYGVEYTADPNIPFTYKGIAALHNLAIDVSATELNYSFTTEEKAFFTKSFNLREFQEIHPYASFPLLVQHYRNLVCKVCSSVPVVYRNEKPLKIMAEELIGYMEHLNLDTGKFVDDLIKGVTSDLQATQVRRLYRYMRHYGLVLADNSISGNSSFKTSGDDRPFIHQYTGGKNNYGT